MNSGKLQDTGLIYRNRVGFFLYANNELSKRETKKKNLKSHQKQ